MAPGRLTGILLVGGASRRFGAPKALAHLGDETLAERTWRVLGEACTERIAVGKRGDSVTLPFEVVGDAFEPRAALAGIVAGLRAARTEVAVVLPVDMPLVTAADLLELAHACADVAMPTTAPLPCALRTTTLPLLERSLAAGALALRDLFAALDARTVAIDRERLANVNVPADLEALRV